MKPHVILNSAMTLDGKIATSTGSSEISGSEDLLRVHNLRKELDAIMVGINTVIADDPRLTIHRIPANESDNPLRIVIDSNARTPLNARILNDEAPTLIAVTHKADHAKIQALKDHDAEIVLSGNEKVDLAFLMDELSHRGIKTLMLEGGSTLNYAMFKDGLINEVRVCIAPMIVGGVNAKTLVDGKGIDNMHDAIKLNLEKSYKLGRDLVLEYTVVK